jgi:hypothetical protein
MKRKRRSKEYEWVTKLTPSEREALMQDCYQQAMRVGSLRAVELRRKVGPNRLYRWAHAKGLPLNRVRTRKDNPPCSP